LVDVYISNNQASWIVNDEDVKKFIDIILHSNRDKIDSEKLSKIEELLKD
jgi:ERCC4-related helicase